MQVSLSETWEFGPYQWDKNKEESISNKQRLVDRRGNILYRGNMLKESDNATAGSCSGLPLPRQRRFLPRFSLRRLLYSSPIIGRRIVRTASTINKNTKGIEFFSYIRHEIIFCSLFVHFKDWLLMRVLGILRFYYHKGALLFVIFKTSVDR